MSYFNEEQEADMKHIASLPDDKVCWCGWGEKGNCPTPSPCDPNFSLADRKKAICPECGDSPWKPGLPTHHRVGCSQREAIKD